ncbi:hypothetical protein CERZMDRAFT_117698 [Cercospora zeae-maydis SCOH1-5]|uniref:PNPLA domain-containing protein n=1 Tax=Cercospora zeae-maydis SCOH1-5 TaxID=717836 RepID=A0A6A6FGJ4_9PEZI|nr:hypothetical protein CERZMDRAFT_117698 [Cercospora zeae-maydis SCOH1-5]
MTSSATKFCPLITVTHSRTTSCVAKFDKAFASLGLVSTATPLFTVLIGKRSKSEILRYFLRKTDEGFLSDRHGQVYLWKDLKTQQADVPTIFVDYELQGYHDSQWSEDVGPGVRLDRNVDWVTMKPGVLSRRSLATLLCSRVFGPLCDTLCYFSADLGGLRVVASYLAEQASSAPVSDLPLQVLPSVVVVVETTAKTYDCHFGTSTLLEAVSNIMVRQYGLTIEAANANIALHFRRIQVLGIRKGASVQERAATIQRRLVDIGQEKTKSRNLLGTTLNMTHTNAFMGQLLEAFCSDYTKTFSFALGSRQDGANHRHLTKHIKEVYTALPSEAYLFHLLCPLLASAILLAGFPPGSHRFEVGWPFDSLFKSKVKKAVYECTVQAATRDAFLKRLAPHLTEFHCELAAHNDVADFHLSTLYRLQKVLSCGHALCDTCIRTFGFRSPAGSQSYAFETCPLCGAAHLRHPFQLIPPTAGIRVLSIDGGGIKGIIPLVFLRTIEERLARFETPICDCFDFVCGTSAGRLIVLGIFLMRWTVVQCLEQFQALAEQTFRPWSRCSSTFARLQELALSYLRDWQYSSFAIEQAFRSAFGADIRMFNPICEDTKVAATTIAAKQPQSCSGATTDIDAGYNLIRARAAADDVSISDAYFKAVNLRNLGVFQDGGLHHNNPLSMALWEVRNLWPQRALPDVALSIGTGVNESVFSSRFHRLNLPMPRGQPPLDDVGAMASPESQATLHIQDANRTQQVIDSLLASSFYLEFDEIPSWQQGEYTCTGFIKCRLPMTVQGRKALTAHLSSTSSFFVINGQLLLALSGSLGVNLLSSAECASSSRIWSPQ